MSMFRSPRLWQRRNTERGGCLSQIRVWKSRKTPGVVQHDKLHLTHKQKLHQVSVDPFMLGALAKTAFRSSRASLVSRQGFDPSEVQTIGQSDSRSLYGSAGVIRTLVSHWHLAC